MQISARISKLHVPLLVFDIIYNGLKPLIIAGIFSWAIDTAVQIAAQQTKDLQDILPILFVYTAYSLISSLMIYIWEFEQVRFNFLITSKLRVINLEKLFSLGLETIEHPEVQNVQQRAIENISAVNSNLKRVAAILTSTVTLLGTVVALATVFPIGIGIIILAAIPALIVDRHFLKLNWNFRLKSTEEKRKGTSNLAILENLKAIPELLIIRGVDFLLNKFNTFTSWWDGWYINQYKKWYLYSFFAENLKYLGRYVNYIVIIWYFVTGIITIGSLTFYKSLVDNLASSVSTLISGITALTESKQQLEPLIQIMEMSPQTEDGSIELPRLDKGPEIEFQNISFTYPRSEKPIYQNLSLKIDSGEKIAIVGHNGAGKTTLVKLISRLYRVDSGEILINNQNLNDLKVDDWYKNIGVLFQEYNTYDHLNVTENIYIGRSVKDLDMERIKEAARSSDAEEFIDEFPNKYDQVLSEKFKGGKRPSTGQWQKLAIARFFYRNAPLVIFDEPTASIDAVSEFKIFNRIYDFFKGKTVIIISHRFSTVRNADRILVMDHGKIIEQGTHTQLMELGGKYAEAFKLQAEGYN